MKRHIPAAFVAIATLAPHHSTADTFTDRDWNTQVAVRCGMPQADSVSQITYKGDRKLRVTLRQGDAGLCSTDRKARHSAPFWERAEVTDVNAMPLGGRYRIRAEVTFLRGFTGERETFLQIHAWAPDCKKAYPPVMLKFTQGRLRVETLRDVSVFSSGRHRNAMKKTVQVQSLYNKPVRFDLDFDTRSRPGRLSLRLNDQQLVTDAPIDFPRCAEPRLKLGIYRPGGKGSGISSVLLDDIRVERTTK